MGATNSPIPMASERWSSLLTITWVWMGRFRGWFCWGWVDWGWDWVDWGRDRGWLRWGWVDWGWGWVDWDRDRGWGWPGSGWVNGRWVKTHFVILWIIYGSFWILSSFYF